MATVFAMDPVCYLLDEPSSGLDENTRNKLIEFLKNHVKTCLIVSHDREFFLFLLRFSLLADFYKEN